MSPTLVIMAAGAGSRYQGLKQLAPIGPCGETLLEYDAGMGQCAPVIYVHQRLDDLPTGFDKPPDRVKPWGTGHAVLIAEPTIDQPFAVVNADDFYGAESYAALFSFLSEDCGEHRLAAVGFRLRETLTDAGPVSRALLDIDEEGHLLKIVEIREVWRQEDRIVYRSHKGDRQTLGGEELVSMNMWGFTPSLLPQLQRHFMDFLRRSGRSGEAEFLLPDVIQSLVREERFRIDVLPGSGEWCGLTFHQDHQRVKSTISSLVARGRYPEALWE